MNIDCQDKDGEIRWDAISETASILAIEPTQARAEEKIDGATPPLLCMFHGMVLNLLSTETIVHCPSSYLDLSFVLCEVFWSSRQTTQANFAMIGLHQIRQLPLPSA
jgi:hypothetical protein